MLRENSSCLDGDPWLRVREVAVYLGAPERTVRDWAHKNKLHGERIKSKIWHFRLSEVDRFSVTLGFCACAHPPHEGRIA